MFIYNQLFHTRGVRGKVDSRSDCGRLGTFYSNAVLAITTISKLFDKIRQTLGGDRHRSKFLLSILKKIMESLYLYTTIIFLENRQ
jgi:hypothetical protein